VQDDTADKPSPRSDLVSGGVWVAIGLAIAVGSWRMDRLESQGVPWFTAPGLLPGIVGVGIVLFALMIVVRALRASAPADDVAPRDRSGRAAISLVLCLGFAAGLVGRVPFIAAAATYLFLHIFILQLPERRAAGQVARGAIVALVIAIVAAVAIGLVFQEIFLVRLP
jgi:hypothetical protein